MRTALVTGASSGIGRATALELAHRGYRVLAGARRLERLEELARQRPGIEAIELDVCRPASVERCFEVLGARPLDALVNNAGYGRMAPVERSDDASSRAMFETNVIAPARLTRAALPRMRAHGGVVLNVSSLVGEMVVPMSGIYAATKHALEAQSDALRREVSASGVRVVVIQPGAIRTDFDDTSFGALAELDGLEEWEAPVRAVRRLAPLNRRFAAPASGVALAIADAVEARSTVARLAVPTPARGQLLLHRALSRGLRERALRRGFMQMGARSRAPMAGAERLALVTGAAGGIGSAIVGRLARAGFTVLATDRDLPALRRLAARCDEQRTPIEVRRLDVTDHAAVRALAEEVHPRGPLALLVNNAGYAEVGPLELLTDEAWRRQLEVNVHGALAMVRAFAPAMRRARAGRIVHISSLLGQVSFPYLGAYCASKHALEAITDAMRLELGAFGVDVVGIQPASVRSGFAERARQTLLELDASGTPYAKDVGRFDAILARLDRVGGEPSDVARLVHRAATEARPAARYRTPLSAIVAAKLLPWLPDAWADRALQRLFA